ncbi:MAG: dephospho-CoA kinase [Anaerolineae bacterium]
MYTIGITGNIGCGKSTILCMLASLGARVIDADKLAHYVMRAGTPVWDAVVAEFGREVVGTDGEINRPTLGRIVFSDPAALHRLEAIVHPAVRAELQAQIAAATEPVVVVEAIKLVEGGLYRLLDALWIVTCAPEQQIERLIHQRGMTQADAAQRIAAQAPIAEKLPLADVVIDNSGSVAEAWQQVRAAWEPLPGVPPAPAAVPPCG